MVRISIFVTGQNTNIIHYSLFWKKKGKQGRHQELLRVTGIGRAAAEGGRAGRGGRRRGRAGLGRCLHGASLVGEIH